MHKVIRILVEAKNKEEALEKAKAIGEDTLFGEDKVYDYGTFFDNEGSKVSGKGRWGNLPDAVLVKSKEGEELIKEGMQSTKGEFKEAIKEIRKILETFTDEDIFEEEIVDIKTKMLNELSDDANATKGLFLAKCHFNRLGYNREAYLYDEEGKAILNNRDLKETINNSKLNKSWVVPCDVHF